MPNLLCYLICTLFTGALTGEIPPENPVDKDRAILTLGKLVLTVSPKGGRITSLKYDKTELLTQRSEHENFGSTLWIGPQSNWGWPPYKTLDDEDYLVKTGEDSVWLQSKPDLVSGFQIMKTIRADIVRNCFVITYTIQNISQETKKLDAWEVTRVPAGGIAFFPEGEKVVLPASNLEGVSRSSNYVWFQCDMNPLLQGQKLYASARDGWLGYAFKNLVLIKEFPDTQPAQYTPEQGEVEIYSNEERKYFELENHGPYTVLAPGESLTYRVRWHLMPLAGDFKSEIGNPELVKVVRVTINK